MEAALQVTEHRGSRSSTPPPSELDDGTVLEPGDHLIGLQFLPKSPEVLPIALARMGFTDVFIDQSVPKTETPKNHLFVGRLHHAIAIRQLEQLRWTSAHKLAIDPFKGIHSPASSGVGHSLETERTYEARFLSRLRAQPTKFSVSQALEAMGWKMPEKLIALKKDMRIPGRMTASVTLWLSIAQWHGPMSFITGEEPFFFEDVAAI